MSIFTLYLHLKSAVNIHRQIFKKKLQKVVIIKSTPQIQSKID